MKPKKPGVSLPEPDMVVSAPQPRKAYTKEFKLSVIAQMQQGQKSVTALALELGLRRNQLYKWASAYSQNEPGKAFSGGGRPAGSEEREIVKLRRQLARANEELTILKKFDAYLTRQKK